MVQNSIRLERLVLFAADKDGRIPFPKYSSGDLQKIRRALARLKKRGLVRKEVGAHPGSSPYVLTDSGRRCMEYMISGTIRNEVESMTWNREEFDAPASGLV